MSYENTECPCGGRKERETMLCHECEAAFAGESDFRIIKDDSFSFSARRGAAITLLSKSRTRRTPYLRAAR